MFAMANLIYIYALMYTLVFFNNNVTFVQFFAQNITLTKTFLFILLIILYNSRGVNIGFFFLKKKLLYSMSSIPLNIGLMNSLAFWHPLLLILCLGFNTYNFVRYYRFSIQLQQRIYIIWCVITILLALFLGMWWAMQEVLWGGIWNWDYVENSLFILTFCVISFFHKKVYGGGKIYFINFFIFSIFIYFILANRSSLFQSPHNFTGSFLSQVPLIYYKILLLLVAVWLVGMGFFLIYKGYRIFFLQYTIVFLSYILFSVFIVFNFQFFKSKPIGLRFFFALLLTNVLLRHYHFVWIGTIVAIKYNLIFILVVLIFRKPSLTPYILKKIHWWLKFFFLVLLFFFFTTNTGVWMDFSYNNGIISYNMVFLINDLLASTSQFNTILLAFKYDSILFVLKNIIVLLNTLILYTNALFIELGFNYLGGGFF